MMYDDGGLYISMLNLDVSGKKGTYTETTFEHMSSLYILDLHITIPNVKQL